MERCGSNRRRSGGYNAGDKGLVDKKLSTHGAWYGGIFRDGNGAVSGLAGSGSVGIFHPWFSSSGPRNQSSSVLGLVFHPWIPNGYPK